MYLDNDIINLKENKISNLKIIYNQKFKIYIDKLILLSDKYLKKLDSSNLNFFLNKNLDFISNNDISNYINNLSIKQNITKKNICLISFIYDKLNFEWLNYVKKIFDDIYLINYSDKKILIENINIFDCNNIKGHNLNLIFLYNDLRNYYNKIIIFEDYNKLVIVKDNKIFEDVLIIKDILYNLSDNFSYIINEILLLDNKYYNSNKCIYLLTSKVNILNLNDSYNHNKICKIPIFLLNNLLNNDISKLNILKKGKFIELTNKIEKFFSNYYESNFNKLQNDYMVTYLKNEYNLFEFVLDNNFINLKNNFLNKNNYDYQIIDNSVILELNNNTENDLIIFLYFLNYCKNNNRKFFLILNEFNINDIIDDFYIMNEKNNLLNNLNSLDDINNIKLYSNNKVIYVNSKIINVNNLENLQFFEIIDKLNYKENLQIKIDEINNLKNIILLDNENDNEIINKVVNSYDILYNLNDYDNNIIKLILKINCNLLISNKFNNLYKLLNKKYINFNDLLKNYKKLLINSKIVDVIDIKLPSHILITNEFNKNIQEFNEIKFIDKIFILDNNNSVKLNKVKYINNINNNSKSIVLNAIITNSKYEYIIIDLKNILDKNLFFFELSENMLLYDKYLYILKYHFDKLNGFNENLENDDEIIYDFLIRGKLVNINNILNKEIDYKLKNLWLPDNISNKELIKEDSNKYTI